MVAEIGTSVAVTGGYGYPGLARGGPEGEDDTR
jgi:hypothetical protein